MAYNVTVPGQQPERTRPNLECSPSPRCPSLSQGRPGCFDRAPSVHRAAGGLGAPGPPYACLPSSCPLCPRPRRPVRAREFWTRQHPPAGPADTRAGPCGNIGARAPSLAAAAAARCVLGAPPQRRLALGGAGLGRRRLGASGVESDQSSNPFDIGATYCRLTAGTRAPECILDSGPCALSSMRR